MASQQKTDNREKIENPGKKPNPDKVEGRKLDDALDDSFPASDPPSQTDPTKGMSVDKSAIGKLHKNAEAKH